MVSEGCGRMASDKETSFKYERRDCLRAVAVVVVDFLMMMGVVVCEVVVACDDGAVEVEFILVVV